jgi:hypothetical protein
MVDRARRTRGQATVSWLIEKLEKLWYVPDYSPSRSILTLGDFREWASRLRMPGRPVGTVGANLFAPTGFREDGRCCPWGRHNPRPSSRPPQQRRWRRPITFDTLSELSRKR